MWIRAVIIAIFLCVSSLQSFAQDICTACENQGCLESYEKSKSENCISCNICLRDKAADNPDTKNRNDNEQAAERSVTIIDNFSVFFGNLEKGDGGQPVKECADEKWEHDAACEDLRFQQRMADSAEKIIDLTWFQIVLSALGLIGILWSLHIAREANEIARNANQTTTDALSRDRAWITEDGFDYTQGLRNQANPEYLGMDIFCRFTNTGKTPARNLTDLHALRIAPTIQECLEIIENLEIDENALTRTVIAPNAVFQTTDQRISISEIEDVRLKRSTCVYVVVFNYTDIFEPNIIRETKIYRKVEFDVFASEVGGQELRLPVFRPMPERPDVLT